MASWDKNKVLPENLNNGNEYANGDVPSLDTFNDANNNAFYAVDFAEAMADTPDTTNVGNVGTPAISLIDNVKNGITYKKFKFENFKGEQGASIVNSGEWNSTTEYVNNANQIDVVVHNANLYICNTTNTNSEPTATNTNWSICANGIVSAVVSGMNISVTFADGTTSVITITGDTVELSEIEIDTTPTANSTNVVTSGGVKALSNLLTMCPNSNSDHKITISSFDTSKGDANTYIAASNGYVYIECQTDAQLCYIKLAVTNGTGYGCIVPAHSLVSMSVPVQKGNIVTFRKDEAINKIWGAFFIPSLEE